MSNTVFVNLPGPCSSDGCRAHLGSASRNEPERKRNRARPAREGREKRLAFGGAEQLGVFEARR